VDDAERIAEVIRNDHVFLILNALVGGLLGIGGSWLFRALHRKDAEKAGEALRLEQDGKRLAARFEIYRVYADPLLMAARALDARLSEFTEHPERGVWFKTTEPQSPFVEYKYVGTLYRLAAFLGWIRAFKRDRVRLDPFDMGMEVALGRRIDKIQGALADGQPVERQRADNLLDHWNIGRLNYESNEYKNLCGYIDSSIDQARHWDGEYKKLKELKAESKLRLGRLLAQGFRETLPSAAIPELTQESAVAIVDKLCIYEALIYRDTQQAIGDMVLIESSGGHRRFEVMGFRSFYEKFGTNELRRGSPDARWVRDLEGLFKDLDMSKPATSDARPQLVKELHKELRHLIEGLEWVQLGVETEAAHMENAMRRLEKEGGHAAAASAEHVHIGAAE
jgi:hypothetical protein